MNFNFSYKLELIVEVLEFAKNKSVKHASKKFNISKSTIYRWKNNDLYRIPFMKLIKHKSKVRKKKWKKKTSYLLKRSNTYDPKFKNDVVIYYETNGRKLTLEKYTISESALYKWIGLKNRNIEFKDIINVNREINSINKKSILNSDRKDIITRLEYLKHEYEFQIIEHMKIKKRYQIIYVMSKNPQITIKTLCVIMKVSKSGYYNWIRNGMPAVFNIDRDLSKYIIGVRETFGDFYGIRRIQRQILITHNIKYNIQIINKHIKILGLETRYHKKSTDNYNHILRFKGRLDNLLLNKNVSEFSKTKSIWVSDLSFIRKPGSKDKHLALKIIMIMNIFDRRVIGYKIIPNRNTGREFRKLLKDCIKRYPKPDIFHSDRGSEYASNDTFKILKDNNILQSFSRARIPTDNAIAERFFGTLKLENNEFKYCKDNKEIIKVAKQWIYFYNNKRFHSGINNIPSNHNKDIEISIINWFLSFQGDVV